MSARKVATHVDVAVVGGGPAGLTTALRLARAGCAVTVIERQLGEPSRPGEQLAARGARELSLLDARLHVARFGSPSPTTRSAWGDSTLHARGDLFGPWGASCIVERAALERALSELLREQGAESVCGEHVVAASRTATGVRLALGSGRLLDTRFVVDASGRSAGVARRLGATILRCDALVALTQRFAVSPGVLERSLLVESSAHGWWYSAPLADGSLLAQYFTDADLLQHAQADAHCREALAHTEHTRVRIASYGGCEDTQVRPACSQRLDRAAGDCWLAVGDAAMAWDPLSSAGLINALVQARDAASVVEAVLAGEGRRALSSYVTRVQRAFARYLVARAQYYRAEVRFADSPFWRRRQNAAALSEPIHLAPDAVLRRGRSGEGSHLVAPGLDRDGVLDAVGEWARASDVAQLLRTRTRGACLDEELIGALQNMISEGVLHELRADPLPPA